MVQLLKVSTYAKNNNKSATWVYNQIREGKVKSKKIDGVTFIILNK